MSSANGPWIQHLVNDALPYASKACSASKLNFPLHNQILLIIHYKKAALNYTLSKWTTCFLITYKIPSVQQMAQPIDPSA